MHDLLVVVSNKDDLDWTRLTKLADVKNPIFLSVDAKENVQAEFSNIQFLMIPENLPDDGIANIVGKLLEMNPDITVLVAVHKTACSGLSKTLSSLAQKTLVQTIYFHHENDDPFWPYLDEFLTCLEKKENVSDSLDKLRSLFSRQSLRNLRNDVLESLSAADLLLQGGDSGQAPVWKEIRRHAELVIENCRPSLLCRKAGCDDIEGTIKNLLQGILENPPALDRDRFVEVAGRLDAIIRDLPA